MTTVKEKIPDHLQPSVNHALAWFNDHEGGGFDVTGIVDPPGPTDAPNTELKLILCGQGTCRQETFRVTTADGSSSGDASGDMAIDWLGAREATPEVAELNPPPGVRRDWIDEVTSKHQFVILLFYRGFW